MPTLLYKQAMEERFLSVLAFDRNRTSTLRPRVHRLAGAAIVITGTLELHATRE